MRENNNNFDQTNGNVSRYRIEELERDVKDMKDTLYGKDGMISQTAVIKQTVEDIKDNMEKKDSKEWVIISGIALCIITVILTNLLGT